MTRNKLNKAIRDSMSQLGIESISRGKKKITATKNNSLSNCVVGGINGKALTVHVGDTVKVLFVDTEHKDQVYWEPISYGTITKITKLDLFRSYNITVKNDGPVSFYTSNKEMGWYRLFQIVKKEKKKCNTL